MDIREGRRRIIGIKERNKGKKIIMVKDRDKGEEKNKSHGEE